MFLDPQPSQESLAASYYHDPKFARSLEAELRSAALEGAHRKLALLGPDRPPRGARVLDVGCSSGAWLEVATDAGLEATGVEVGEATGAAARDRGLDVITGTLAEARPQLGDRRFDLITFWDVLEHLRDPRRELALARDLLSDGGSVAATFPNVEGIYPVLTLRLLTRRTGVWEHPELPVHLYDFAPATARRLFERSGFEPRRLETHPIPFEFFRSVALSPERIGGGRRARLLRGAFDALHRVAYPLARATDRGNSIFLLAGRAAETPH